VSVKVIVATRGRAPEVRTLVDLLRAATAAPSHIVVVGSKDEDIEGVEPRADAGGEVYAFVGPAGLTSQRNAGVRHLRESTDWRDDDVIAFFDDDFRPHRRWLEHAAELLLGDHAIAGVTGLVLADGAKTEAVTEEEADRLIQRWDQESGDAAPGRIVDKPSLYGCNMAVRASLFDRCGFDEKLPLYGWLEDLDFSGQALRTGRIVRYSRCGGVHLGSKGGRVSGRRYGYSQIVNPVHLAKRRTTSVRTALFMTTRAVASNSLRSLARPGLFDYRGRLVGNLVAIRDLLRGRVDPRLILKL
jgi:GT2 family glycosyltransferase